MTYQIAETTLEVADALNTASAKMKPAGERYALRLTADLLSEIAHSESYEHSDALWRRIKEVAEFAIEELHV